VSTEIEGERLVPLNTKPASVEEAPAEKAEEEVAEYTSPPWEARFQAWVMVAPEYKVRQMREILFSPSTSTLLSLPGLTLSFIWEGGKHTTGDDVHVEGGDLGGTVVGDLDVIDLVVHTVGVPGGSRAGDEGDLGRAGVGDGEGEGAFPDDEACMAVGGGGGVGDEEEVVSVYKEVD
jgi:hypothetical protein